MTKSQDGQDHMDKYFDTSRNILSQELKKDHVQYGSYYILYLRSYDQCQYFFLNWTNVKLKVISKIIISKKKKKVKRQGHKIKIVVTNGEVLSHRIFM